MRNAEKKAERGEKGVVDVPTCVSFLNMKPDNSVVYICFGTICYFLDKQLYEIASALEALDNGFIWVVPEKKGKYDESEEEKEKWLPKGFEERNIKKGVIIRGWAPQMVILGHPAVGSFLTHCGWNSVIEAVVSGIPMITWSVHSDQFYNEKLVTQVRGIGVEVGADEWLVTAYRETGKLVGRDLLEKAIRRLMDSGDEAIQFKQCAQELRKKARHAIQEGASSHRNLTTLIDHLKQVRLERLLDTEIGETDQLEPVALSTSGQGEIKFFVK